MGLTANNKKVQVFNGVRESGYFKKLEINQYPIFEQKFAVELVIMTAHVKHTV